MEWIMQHKLVVVGIIVFVGGSVMFALSQKAPPVESLITSETPNGSGSENIDPELVATLLALRSVTLSGTIFKDPAFISLRDFGTNIIAEPIGRQNPFAPLSEGATAPSSQQTPTGTQR